MHPSRKRPDAFAIASCVIAGLSVLAHQWYGGDARILLALTGIIIGVIALGIDLAKRVPAGVAGLGVALNVAALVLPLFIG